MTETHKVHLRHSEERPHWARCRFLRNVSVTTRPEDVTCEHCLRIIRPVPPAGLEPATVPL